MRIRVGNQWRDFRHMSIGTGFIVSNYSSEDWGKFKLYSIHIDLLIFYVEVEW